MEKTEHHCNRCQQTKPITEFYKASWCKDGYRPTCNACRREDHLKNNYNVDSAWYDEHSKNGCELCGLTQYKSSGASSNRKWLNVDHNHTTGKARGVLCSDCNRALGKYFEDPEMHSKIMEYLKRGL